MLSLDSPRWKELRHAYGPATDIPGLIKAIAESDPTEMRKHPSPWKEVWSNLCHQTSVYPATYAAIPHLVSIAQHSSLTNRLEVLVLCGTILAFGNDVGAAPEDLLESFELAMKTLRGLSLSIARDAVGQNLIASYPLPYLIQAILVLRFGANSVALSLTDDDYEFEAQCPECESSIYVNAQDIPTEPTDRAARDANLQTGLQIVNDTAEDQWPADCIAQIAAALASSSNDSLLAQRILNLCSTVECESCESQFQLAAGLV